MDDHLEKPSSSTAETEDENAMSSGDEGGPDWTKYKSTSKLLSLPKRGDKEFEPAERGATDLQKFALDRSRQAMFSALAAQLDTNNKSVSYAVWYPDLARAEVYQARGVLFTGMGHSVPRGEAAKRRLELLPEETLYLVERGSLFCWKDTPGTTIQEHGPRGAPMSVQQAYAEMIGRENLTLDRYHAYAYLKRLGFNVIRSHAPSACYPRAAPFTPPPKPGLVSRLLGLLPFAAAAAWARLRRLFFPRMDWWRPLHFHWLLGCARDYPSVYRALRVIPSGHHTCALPPPPVASPYEIFYHVYKPSTTFKKSAPPPPDFSLVVVGANTPLPTIHELTRLWSFLPETGPPPPRQRQPQAAPRQTPRGPHPFALLKAGRKTIVVGVADSGTIGFFRFGMGAFEAVPMI